MPAGVHPDDLARLEDLAKFPFTTRVRPARRLSLRHVRRAARATSSACTPPAAPPASPPSSATPRTTSTTGPTWSPARSAPRAAGPATSCHIAYGYGLFTGGLGAHYGAERLGCTVIPMSRRQHRAAGPADPRLQAATSSWSRPRYVLNIVEDSSAMGSTRATSLRDRHLRRRALDRRDAPGDRGAARHRRGRHLRPVGGHGPGCGQRVRRDQGRPDHLGGPLLPRDHRPGDRRGAAGRRGGRTGVHLAHQGSAADHPLPDARPHAGSCRRPRARCGAWTRSPAAPTTC